MKYYKILHDLLTNFKKLSVTISVYVIDNDNYTVCIKFRHSRRSHLNKNSLFTFIIYKLPHGISFFPFPNELKDKSIFYSRSFVPLDNCEHNRMLLCKSKSMFVNGTLRIIEKNDKKLCARVYIC